MNYTYLDILDFDLLYIQGNVFTLYSKIFLLPYRKRVEILESALSYYHYQINKSETLEEQLQFLERLEFVRKLKHRVR